MTKTTLTAACMLSIAMLTGCTSGDSASLMPVTAGAPVRVALAPAAPLGSLSAAGAPRAVAVANPVATVAPAATPNVQRTALVSPNLPTAAAPAAIDATLAATRIDLAPITGAPARTLPPLSRAMAERGRQIGLGLGGTPTHRLKGYFSINDDGAETRVVYIWDVVDSRGRRVHRIQGQEQLAQTSRGDAWAIVRDETMAAIGRKTVDRFAEWRRKG